MVEIQKLVNTYFPQESIREKLSGVYIDKKVIDIRGLIVPKFIRYIYKTLNLPFAKAKIVSTDNYYFIDERAVYLGNLWLIIPLGIVAYVYKLIAEQTAIESILFLLFFLVALFIFSVWMQVITGALIYVIPKKYITEEEKTTSTFLLKADLPNRNQIIFDGYVDIQKNPSKLPGYFFIEQTSVLPKLVPIPKSIYYAFDLSEAKNEKTTG